MFKEKDIGQLKTEQRAHFREKRKAIPELSRLSQSLTVNRALAIYLAEHIEARREQKQSEPLHVCAYMAMEPELSLEPLLEDELRRAVEEGLLAFYIPKTARGASGTLDLTFGHYRHSDLPPCARHQSGVLGIAEPLDKDLVEDLRPDIILLPCVAFDTHGSRVGQGAGCYDRYLAKLHAKGIKPICVVVGYKEQEAEYRLPIAEHDWPMDYAASGEFVRKLDVKKTELGELMR